MKNPIISVIMPVYNAENFIEDSVKSILNQSFKEIEVICINDCSPDNSLQKLYELQAYDTRVKVLDLQKNVGAGAARNAGLEIATGQYVTFVDADDVIEQELYAKAYEACRDGMIDQVVWGLVEDHYDKEGNLIKQIPITAKNETLLDQTGFVEKILELEEKTLFGYLWNSMYRTEIIKSANIKIPDLLFYEDYFFNLEFAKISNSLTTIDFIGYHYAKRPNNSITHQFTKDYYSLSYSRIESMYTFCIERGFSQTSLYTVLGNRLLRYTLSALSRNSNKKSEMTYQEQKDWFNDICGKSLYTELLSQCVSSNIVHSILKWCIEHKKSIFAVTIGNAINLIRR